MVQISEVFLWVFFTRQNSWRTKNFASILLIEIGNLTFLSISSFHVNVGVVSFYFRKVAFFACFVFYISQRTHRTKLFQFLVGG